MKVSKLGALWSLLTGGWSGLIVYILEAVNGFLSKLDQAKLAKVAQITACIAQALKVILDTFLPEKYRAAANLTIAALNKLTDALADGKVTEEELTAQIEAVEAAIDAWKAVK